VRAPSALSAIALLALSACATPQAAKSVGESFRDCTDCPKMVLVPAGQFRMGSPEDERPRDADEGPQRAVTIAKPFAIGRTEVTRGEFAKFVAATGRTMPQECVVWENGKIGMGPANWRAPGFAQSDNHPVVCITWRDAAAYAAWLAKETGKPYRLPSEAEWEYAARGGTQSDYTFPGGEDAACAYGNVADRAAKAAMPNWRTANCDDGVGFGTAKVASYKPNGFGLYDTVGNVWEWVADCYRPNFEGAPIDGSAWGDAGACGAALDRGGGWTNLMPGHLRAANRSRAPSPDNPAASLGFRVARGLTPDETVK
jgi:formylglycine-generating enzyme required for sulfatase activity